MPTMYDPPSGNGADDQFHLHDGFVTDGVGLTAQPSRLARSAPPTGMRLTRILGQLRVHLRSVGRQIGPDSLLEFVQKVIRQDIQDQSPIER